MTKVFGAILFFSLFGFSANSIECSRFLNTGNPTSKLIMPTSVILSPEAQFIDPEKIVLEVARFIKTDSISVLFEDIFVSEVKYNKDSDEIEFLVEYKVKTPLSNLNIIFTKTGKYDFSYDGKIKGFTLHPIYRLVPAGLLSQTDSNDYNIWLADFIKQSNFWNSKLKYSFGGARDIFVTPEGQAALPILLTKASALSFSILIESTIWLGLPVDLRKQIESITVNQFDEGEFGHGSFEVTIILNNQSVEKSGYHLKAHVHIHKNKFRISRLSDNFEELELDNLKIDTITQLIEIGEYFKKENPYKKFIFVLE